MLYSPNEVGLIQPGGPTSTTLRRLYQPINNISTWVQEDMINASNYNSLQANYTKRYYARTDGAHQLHLQQVAGLWRLGCFGWRRGRQPANRNQSESGLRRVWL